MMRLLVLIAFLFPLTLSAQKVVVGPAPTRPTITGTYNLTRNATTGLMELTPVTGSAFLMAVDTAQIKGWTGIKGLFRPFNWEPTQFQVQGLVTRLAGIDAYATNLTTTKADASALVAITGQLSDINTHFITTDGRVTALENTKANVSTVTFLEQTVTQHDTAIANRATKAEVAKLVTPTGDPSTTAYPRTTTDYLLGQKANANDVNNSLTLKVDVTRSRKIVTLQAFGGSATANFNNLTAANAALAELKAAGGGTLYLPKGRYVTGPWDLNGASNIAIVADPGSVTLVRTVQRGPAIFGAVDNVTISGLIIDCDSSQFEGGIRLAGSNNLISRVQVLKGDATSFIISAAVFNGGGATKVTNNNRVEYCYAKGQKRYHDVAGTSPFIAGDYATNTTFYACVVEDCYNADAFDSDNSNGTLFENCVARSNGQLTGLTAFWCEGEQTDNDHTAKFINCSATGYTNAFAAGERAKMIVEGGQAISCTRAFQGLNNVFRAYVSGVTAVSCGTGTSTLTDGIFTSYGPVTFRNNTTSASASGVNSYCNYSGAPTYDVFRVEGGTVDRNIRAAYSTGGLQTVELSNIRLFAGAYLIYTDGQNHTLTTSGLVFDDGGISGSRIGKGVHRNAKFTSTDTGRTHINLQTDNFNTFVENSEFNGGSQVSNYATLGGGVRTYSVTNVPNTPESRAVQGDGPASRTRYVTSLDGNAPSGFYNVQGTWQGFPSTIGHWLVTRVHHENSGTTGGASSWMTDTAVDMYTGTVYTSTKFDDGRGWLAPHRLVMIPANGLQNGTMMYFDSATSQFKFLQPGTSGQFLKIVSGVPAWSN